MFSNDERRGRCFPLTLSALCLLEPSFYFFSRFNPLKICRRLSLHPHPHPHPPQTLPPLQPLQACTPLHSIRWGIQTCVIYLSFTAVARKRSRSFCQKCRWQLKAIQAYTLRMWLCMKIHGAWLHGVHRTCTEKAAVSCGTSHASAVSTPLRWLFKKRYKKLFTHVESHASTVSLLESGE